MSAPGGAEARHRHSDYPLAVKLQPVKGTGGHKQGKRRIQSAGNPDNQTFASGSLETLGQSRHLDIDNLVTPAVYLIVIPRDEGMGVYRAEQSGCIVITPF